MKSAGRHRPDIKEVTRLWSVLPEQEKRDWENKSRDEEKRQMELLKERKATQLNGDHWRLRQALA